MSYTDITYTLSKIMPTREYKVVIIGECGVGKSTFLKRYRTQEFESEYVPTMGIGNSSLTFHTNKGTVIFNILDCAGQEQFEGLYSEYCSGAHAALVMFDTTNEDTYTKVPSWISLLQKLRYKNTSGKLNIPVIICGNKSESEHREVMTEDITVHTNYDLQYYDISVKTCYNVNKPFLYLIRSLINDFDVELIDPPPTASPIILIRRINPLDIHDDTDESDLDDIEDFHQYQCKHFSDKVVTAVDEYRNNHTQNETSALMRKIMTLIAKENNKISQPDTIQTTVTMSTSGSITVV
jgi:GTP-binding nuclear protein Ran